jgi:hypothetical protein
MYSGFLHSVQGVEKCPVCISIGDFMVPVKIKNNPK